MELNKYIPSSTAMLTYLSDTLTYWGPDKLDGRHFADDIFKCISFIKNVCVLIKI